MLRVLLSKVCNKLEHTIWIQASTANGMGFRSIICYSRVLSSMSRLSNVWFVIPERLVLIILTGLYLLQEHPVLTCRCNAGGCHKKWILWPFARSLEREWHACCGVRTQPSCLLKLRPRCSLTNLDAWHHWSFYISLPSFIMCDAKKNGLPPSPGRRKIHMSLLWHPLGHVSYKGCL